MCCFVWNICCINHIYYILLQTKHSDTVISYRSVVKEPCEQCMLYFRTQPKGIILSGRHHFSSKCNRESPPRRAHSFKKEKKVRNAAVRARLGSGSKAGSGDKRRAAKKAAKSLLFVIGFRVFPRDLCKEFSLLRSHHCAVWPAFKRLQVLLNVSWPRNRKAIPLFSILWQSGAAVWKSISRDDILITGHEIYWGIRAGPGKAGENVCTYPLEY